MESFVSDSFMNELHSALRHSPVTYIPSFHHNYVDYALERWATEFYVNDGVSLDDVIYEYNESLASRVDFHTKKTIREETYSSIDSLLKELTVEDVYEKDLDLCTLSRYKVFLIKGNATSILTTKVQGLLQIISEKYARQELRNSPAILLVCPDPIFELPSSICKISRILEIPVPTLKEIEHIVYSLPITSALVEEEEDLVRKDLVKTLQGLTYFDLEQILPYSIDVTRGRINPLTRDITLREKKKIVRKSGTIEVVETNVSFDDIGGMEALREDLKKVAVIYKNLSAANSQFFKVGIPKGCLIVGMPGCGKSMIAKAIANEFDISLLRLDISKLMGKYVGESEENLREALATAESAHPACLWIDEIEKAFASGDSGDGNDLVKRLMGQFLTWMQERQTPVYVVATANDALKPEFMRKGRFDEVYFVNFPNLKERKSIFKIVLEEYVKNNPLIPNDFTDKDGTLDMKAVNEFARNACIEKNQRTNDAESVEKLSSFIQAAVKGDFSSYTEDNSLDGELGYTGAEIRSIVDSLYSDKFIEYITSSKEQSKRHVTPLTKQNVLDAIKRLSDVALAGQQNEQVSKISSLVKKYKFKKASR